MLKKDVIDYFGSIRKAAEFLGVSTQCVYQWPDIVPKSAAYELHVKTKGKLDATKEDPVQVE